MCSFWISLKGIQVRQMDQKTDTLWERMPELEDSNTFEQLSYQRKSISWPKNKTITVDVLKLYKYGTLFARIVGIGYPNSKLFVLINT